jgi:hypothetical protein
VIKPVSGLLATLLTFSAVSAGSASPESPAGYSVSISSNNGSVPPPYHRATEIEVDAQGRGHYTRRLGYDRNDASQKFERDFQISAEQQAHLGALIEELNVFHSRWQELERPTVGGSSTTIRCTHGNDSIVIPSQLIPEQREARERLAQAVQALVPEEVIKAMTDWSASRQDNE